MDKILSMDVEKNKMKAATIIKYGGLSNIRITQAPRPKPKANEVLVKVICSSVNYANVAHVKANRF
ncbi:hypothetical protein [Flavivirga rizhaonensis]|uniref:NAD(P)-dependent alcohol dehydrogenase n=1 Tax=Flavivirga rizhaonensis TaxID=2559571 RepID=A0A4S1DZ22_9FLAO|nr:hypothetical protein [Flavivirga rizhaonensis]TGV02812.1 hypothetical protein EM932_08815 [Flavivirga rizhaonensis]